MGNAEYMGAQARVDWPRGAALGRSDEAVASAAEMEACHGGFCARSGARAVLAMAFVAVVLAFLASGGSLKGASLAGAVVLASPTLFDVARELCIAPKKMLVS